MRATALSILSALLLFSTACFPVVDDGGPVSDAGTSDGGATDGGGGGDAGLGDGGRDDGGLTDGGRTDGGGTDAGQDAGGHPCDGWPQTDYAYPGCGPAALGVEFDSTELGLAYADNGCSYQGVTWIFGDGSSTTEAYPYHVYEEPGDYYVRAEGDGVCCEGGTCTTLGLNLTEIPIRAY